MDQLRLCAWSRARGSSPSSKPTSPSTPMSETWTMLEWQRRSYTAPSFKERSLTHPDGDRRDELADGVNDYASGHRSLA